MYPINFCDTHHVGLGHCGSSGSGADTFRIHEQIEAELETRAWQRSRLRVVQSAGGGEERTTKCDTSGDRDRCHCVAVRMKRTANTGFESALHLITMDLSVSTHIHGSYYSPMPIVILACLICTPFFRTALLPAPLFGHVFSGEISFSSNFLLLLLPQSFHGSAYPSGFSSSFFLNSSGC